MGYFDEDLGVLNFCDDQAVNGMFEETEEFCVKNDIGYDRQSDHYCEYDAERVSFRPGMNHPVIIYTDSRGEEIVNGDTVREAKNLLAAVVSSTNNVDARIHEALRFLDDACRPIPDELQNFQLTS